MKFEYSEIRDSDSHKTNNSKHKKNENIKVVVLGKGVVGKTSLVFKMMNIDKDLNNSHYATIEDRHTFNYLVNEKQRKIDILDTAGEDDYQNMMDVWIEFGECFILMFSLTSLETFQALEQIHQRIVKIKNKNIPIILVGNKGDLESQREIETEMAANKAYQWGIDYIETSAKTGYNVLKVLDMLLPKVNKSQDENKGTESMFSGSVSGFSEDPAVKNEGKRNHKGVIIILVVLFLLSAAVGGGYLIIQAING